MAYRLTALEKSETVVLVFVLDVDGRHVLSIKEINTILLYFRVPPAPVRVPSGGGSPP